MLTQVAEGVLVHQSELLQNNAVVVQGRAGVLLVDPGITGRRDGLPRERPPRVGPARGGRLRDASRLGPRALARRARRRAPLRHRPLRGSAARPAVERGLEGRVAEGLPPEIADDVPLDLFGLITGLPAGTALVPWEGPDVRIIEHPAHAPGPCGAVDRGARRPRRRRHAVRRPDPDARPAPPTRSRTTSSGCGCSRTWRATSMSSSPVTGPSAEPIRCAHGSTWIGRTCRPCGTATLPMTRGSAHRRSRAGSG